jgi:hypothetical protein
LQFPCFWIHGNQANYLKLAVNQGVKPVVDLGRRMFLLPLDDRYLSQGWSSDRMQLALVANK